MIEPVLDDARAARRGEPDQGEPGSGGRVVRRGSAGDHLTPNTPLNDT